jgi:hypothetical protein
MIQISIPRLRGKGCSAVNFIIHLRVGIIVVTMMSLQVVMVLRVVT